MHLKKVRFVSIQSGTIWDNPRQALTEPLAVSRIEPRGGRGMRWPDAARGRGRCVLELGRFNCQRARGAGPRFNKTSTRLRHRVRREGVVPQWESDPSGKSGRSSR